MTAVTHGMDPNEVDRLGAELQRVADQLEQTVRRLDGTVNSVSWIGVDASRFKQEWWPSHRGHLFAVATDLRGFGDSAKNNATEQRETSDAGGTGPGGSGATGSGPGPSEYVPTGVGQPGPGGKVGSTSGSLAGSDRTWQEVNVAYRQWSGGLYGANGDSRYQCTAWANFRWRELGYDGPMINGNGVAMAANAGGTVDTPPTLGAMASRGGADGYGHVMIVEEVAGDRIRVSEMNIGSNPNVGLPEEYYSERWLVRQTNGTWTHESDGRNVGEITFASLRQ